jgi:hypothetical protein
MSSIAIRAAAEEDLSAIFHTYRNAEIYDALGFARHGHSLQVESQG